MTGVTLTATLRTGTRTVPPDTVTAVPGAGSAQVTIAGSDRTDVVLERILGPPANPTAVPGGGTVAESGGTAAYRVWLRGDMPSRAVPVSWRVTVPGGDASAEAADFGGALPESASPLEITRAGVDGAIPFTVPVAADDEPEGDERFSVTAATAAANTVTMTATVTTTIADDDVGVGVRPLQPLVPEGEAATFTFTRATGALTGDVTVLYSVTGVEGADFSDPGGGRVAIPSGQSRATIAVAILNDGETEDDETLQLTIDAVQVAGPGAGAIAAAARTAAVRIPRLLVTVALSGPELVEEGAVARFPVMLSLAPAGEPTVAEVALAYTLGADTDSATRGSDYAAPPGGFGTLRIPAGEVSGTIEVPVLRDGVPEAEEVFSLALALARSMGRGAAIRSAATPQRVRIADTADQEARRERRTRALLAATDRAAAHMATDVITARSESQLGTQSDAAGGDTTPLATDALSTALRLTGLSPAGIGGDAAARGTAAGLRFESPNGTRFGVEAGVDFHRRRGDTDTAATTSPIYQFLLTGDLEF